MRKSTFAAALGTAVTTGGAIAALTVLPLHSVSAQSTGTTETTTADSTTAPSTTTPTTAAGAAAAAAATTTTVASNGSSSSTTPTTAPAAGAQTCTPNEDPAHEAQETPEQEAAESAGQCRGGPHGGPGHHRGPGGPRLPPHDEPQPEAQEP